MKILTIVGTRPEIIKMSRVMSELEKFVTHILVHTGQNYDYELNKIFFDNLDIKKPDYYLDAASKNTAHTIGNIISKVDDVLEIEKPDAILLYGDTNSCLSVIPAKRRKIPIFHFEAGNRCFDQRVPEELNRKIVDHLSDINFCLTEHARRYLIAEGIKSETIIKTGSPMKEIIDLYSDQINSSQIISELKLKPTEYFIVSTHREENIEEDKNFNDLLDSLNAIASNYGLPIIVSTHPRTQKKLKLLKRDNIDPLIRFIKPLGFFDYIKLQKNALCVISDSGTITEEASILNFPAITVRQSHERPEGMDEGTLIMSGLHKDLVLKSINIVISQHRINKNGITIVSDYNLNNYSAKVVRNIISYIDYVNRNTWKK